jgi:hypothetical protein
MRGSSVCSVANNASVQLANAFQLVEGRGVTDEEADCHWAPYTYDGLPQDLQV